MIEPQFSYARQFSEGLAIASPEGHPETMGFINEQGKFVMPPIYTDATPLHDGIAWVYSDKSAMQALDNSGKVVFSLPEALSVKGFNEGFASYCVLEDNNMKWGVINKKGEKIIAPQYSAMGIFYGNSCPVMDANDKWGMIDKTGKLIINFQFDGIGAYAEGKRVVVLNGKYGLIDTTGRYIVEPQYDEIVPDKDILLIKQNGLWGWADKGGKIFIEPQFKYAAPFGNSGYAVVQTDDKCGYINKTGKIVIKPQCDFAGAFDGDMAWVSTNNKSGFINNDGKFVIEPNFGNIPFDYRYMIYNQSAETIYSIGNAEKNNVPSVVTLSFVQDIKHFMFSAAKGLATKTSEGYIDNLQKTQIEEHEQNHGINSIRSVASVKIEKDKAYVACLTNQQPYQEVFTLVKQNGKWLIQNEQNTN